MLPLIHAYRLIRQADQQRAGVPGEHWATFAAAYGTLRWASHVRSPLLRTAAYVAGGALVLRAIGGRDGLLAKLRRRPSAPGPTSAGSLSYEAQPLPRAQRVE
jgi:hypothetical protein